MENGNLTINNEDYNLNYQNIFIKDIKRVDDYLFITLDNGQKILTNGDKIYDASEYDFLVKIFTMGDKLCAVLRKDVYALCVVNLNNMEVLFADYKAYLVTKQDERTLCIHLNDGNIKTLYDIENKKYLPRPKDYEFESSLGNNLYVFREANSKESFFNYKRCVINIDGKIILKDIKGWIEYQDNHLIIKKDDGLCIIKINEDMTLKMQEIKQNENIIAKPEYNDGEIILIEKGAVRIYNLDFGLIREFKMADLEKVNDYELIEDTLKMAVPNIVDGKDIGKHLFLNLKNGRTISHLRIDGYPHWTPTTFVGQDSLKYEEQDFHFYDEKFNYVAKISGCFCDSIECNRECIFIIESLEDGKNKIFNAANGKVLEANYDYVYFHSSKPYGYGVNIKAGKMQFFDENLNILIKEFDYQKYHINYEHSGFYYFIVNGYLCVIKHIADGPKSIYRNILVNAKGEVILDSTQCDCYQIGSYIHILSKDDSKFLNTLTNEICSLSLNAPVDENGKIDFKKVSNFNNFLISSQSIKRELDNGQNRKLKK